MKTAYTHTALLYETLEEFVSALESFTHVGAELDEHVLIVVDRRKGDLLRERLSSTHAFTIADSAEVYTSPGRTLAGYINSVRDNTSGGRSMRVAGEPIWSGLSTVDTDEWTCVEAACNVVFSEAPLTMLCPYDVSHVDQRIIEAARRTHPLLQTHGAHTHSAEFVSPYIHHAAIRCGTLPPPSRPFDRVVLSAAAELAGMRQFVRRFCRNHSMPDGRIDDFVLAVSELVSDAVEHAIGAVEVRVWSAGSSIACDVEAGHWSPPAFAGLLPPTSATERGRGVWIARQVCDSFAVRSDGALSTTRVEIFTPPEARPATCDAIDLLLGAFVLEACNDSEDHAIRDHLSTCAGCRSTEAQLRAMLKSGRRGRS